MLVGYGSLALISLPLVITVVKTMLRVASVRLGFYLQKRSVGGLWPENAAQRQQTYQKLSTVKSKASHYPMNHPGSPVRSFTVHARYTEITRNRNVSIMMSYRWPIARAKSCPRIPGAGQYFTTTLANAVHRYPPQTGTAAVIRNKIWPSIGKIPVT
uniref:Uncharacterized protein n=1 Tax=Anopheles culicifacies TaxID=139723 RepID=A0A182MMI0_9DIPT